MNLRLAFRCRLAVALHRLPTCHASIVHGGRATKNVPKTMTSFFKHQSSANGGNAALFAGYCIGCVAWPTEEAATLLPAAPAALSTPVTSPVFDVAFAAHIAKKPAPSIQFPSKSSMSRSRGSVDVQTMLPLDGFQRFEPKKSTPPPPSSPVVVVRKVETILDFDFDVEQILSVILLVGIAATVLHASSGKSTWVKRRDVKRSLVVLALTKEVDMLSLAPTEDDEDSDESVEGMMGSVSEDNAQNDEPKSQDHHVKGTAVRNIDLEPRVVAAQFNQMSNGEQRHTKSSKQPYNNATASSARRIIFHNISTDVLDKYERKNHNATPSSNKESKSPSSSSYSWSELSKTAERYAKASPRDRILTSSKGADETPSGSVAWKGIFH
mmetsp:Transcript_2436/g.4498  ORF Transcript_2436/g.4498 Transcript_2436/m.4498 type:complete len:382 (+) Transcript_2436:250-1395(+)